MQISLTNKFKLFIGILGGVVVVMIAAVAIWYMMALKPVRSDSGATGTTFVYAKGTSLPELAAELESRKLIRSSTAFIWYVVLHGLRGGLQAGSYSLSPSDSTGEIVEAFHQGRVASDRLVVPEGATMAEIEELAIEQGISKADFDAALKASHTDPVLASRPAGYTSLEGYLFPDTYDLVKPVNAADVVQKMLDNSSKKIAATDSVPALAAQGLTLHQGLTLASIVEKEVSNPDDRKKVAQVFINRLKIRMPLQSDVTVIYAANLLNKGFDLQIDSLYNTYKYSGLPPGPMNNPSIESLQAVAHPAPNDYLYFVADKAGRTYYAKTLAEHDRNVAQYMNK